MEEIHSMLFNGEHIVIFGLDQQDVDAVFAF